MKHLVIAEKSSAGKDMARVLGLTDKNMQDGYMENDEYMSALKELYEYIKYVHVRNYSKKDNRRKRSLGYRKITI